MSSANPVHIRTICILDTFLVWQSYFYESFFIWGKHITCARRMRIIMWIQSIPPSMNHMREIQRPYTKFLYSDLFYFIFSFKLICCFQRILIFFCVPSPDFCLTSEFFEVPPFFVQVWMFGVRTLKCMSKECVHVSMNCRTWFYI